MRRTYKCKKSKFKVYQRNWHKLWMFRATFNSP